MEIHMEFFFSIISGNKWFGVNFDTDAHIADNFKNSVLDPVKFKQTALSAAFDAARAILSNKLTDDDRSLPAASHPPSAPSSSSQPSIGWGWGILGVVVIFFIALIFQRLFPDLATNCEKYR